MKEHWPIYFKTPDKYTDSSKKKISQKGKIVGLNLERGDGVVYKGCERPHWRDAMPGTFEEMNGYLRKPQSYIKGTKMAFAGLRKEKDRASVILYLNQNSDNPLPLP